MPINLRIRYDLSLQDLLDKRKAGFTLFKTPHVGNHYPNNLACAHLGIPLKVMDQTKGCLDRNFHPDSVIVGGKKTRITTSDTLMTHAVIERSVDPFNGRFQVGASASGAHMKALRDAIPSTEAMTMSEYLCDHEEKMMMLLEVMTGKDPSIWTRFVSSSGVTRNGRLSGGWERILASGICGIGGCKSGWVIPNIANILSDVTIDPSQDGSDRVYELSGPDMYKYIHKMIDQLSEMYDHVRRVLGWGLPEAMEFNIVPVSEMRFATTASRKQEMDDLIRTLCHFQEFESGVGERMKRASDKRAEITVVKLQRCGQFGKLRDALASIPEVLYDIYDGSYLTQYDLLALGEQLYVPEEATLLCMEQVKDMTDRKSVV